MRTWRPAVAAALLIWGLGARAEQTTETATDKGETAAAASTGTLTAERKPLELSREWRARLRAAGFTAEEFATLGRPKLNEADRKEVDLRTHYLLATHLLETGKVEESISEFKAALQDDPGSTQILHGLTRAHMAADEFKEADEILDRILKQDPKDVQALIEKAQILVARADSAGNRKRELLRQAVEYFQQARRIQPKNMDALQGLAAAYIGLQDISRIIQAYRDILKANPKDIQSTLVLANLLADTGRVQEAISLYEKVIEERRGFITTYLFLGQLYEEKVRQIDKAIETYKRALVIDPRSEKVRERFERALLRKYGEQNRAAAVNEYARFAAAYPQSSGIQRLYAERLVSQRDFPKAIEQYRKVVDLDPGNVEALVTLAQLLQQNRQYDEARTYLEKAVDVDPTRVDAYNALADSYIAQGQAENAVEVYRKALRLNPEQDKLLIALADVLSRTGDAQAAVQTLQDMATTSSAARPEFLAVLGQAYERARNYDQAVEYYGKAFEKAPSSLPIIGKLLAVNLRRGNVAAAEQVTTQVLDKGALPKDDIYALAGEAFLAEGYPDKAAEAYEQAFLVNQDSLKLLTRLVEINNLRDAHRENYSVLDQVTGTLAGTDEIQELRAQTLLDEKKYTEALEIYRSLMAAHPSSEDWLRTAIDALLMAKQYDEALGLLDKHRELLGREDSLALRGVVLYKAGRYAAAEKAFNELLKAPGLTPNDISNFHFYLGSIALDQKKYDKAEKAFRSAIQVNPVNDAALNALGYMLADRNVQLTEAKDLIEKALGLNPSGPHILDSMGWVLYRLGEYEEALDYVQRAHRLTGDDPEILDHLGDIYSKLDQKLKAQEVYRRALELDPARPGLRVKAGGQAR